MPRPSLRGLPPQPRLTPADCDVPLPPLRVALVNQAGRFVRFVEVVDARRGFARSFNELDQPNLAFPWVPEAIDKLAPTVDHWLAARMLQEVEAEAESLLVLADSIRQRRGWPARAEAAAVAAGSEVAHG